MRISGKSVIKIKIYLNRNNKYSKKNKRQKQ